jgi:hypothetical protein
LIIQRLLSCSLKTAITTKAAILFHGKLSTAFHANQNLIFQAARDSSIVQSIQRCPPRPQDHELQMQRALN